MDWRRNILVALFVFLIANSAMIATLMSPEFAYSNYDMKKEPIKTVLNDNLIVSDSKISDNTLYILLSYGNDLNSSLKQLLAINGDGEIRLNQTINFNNSGSVKIGAINHHGIFLVYLHNRDYDIFMFSHEGELLKTFPSIYISSVSYHSMVTTTNYIIISLIYWIGEYYRLLAYNVETDEVIELFQIKTPSTLLLEGFKVTNYKGTPYMQLLNKLDLQDPKTDYAYSFYEIVERNNKPSLEFYKNITISEHSAKYTLVVSTRSIIQIQQQQTVDNTSIYVEDKIANTATNWAISEQWTMQNTFILDEMVVITYAHIDNRGVTKPLATMIQLHSSGMNYIHYNLTTSDASVGFYTSNLYAAENDIFEIRQNYLPDFQVNYEILILHNSKRPGILLSKVHPVVQFNAIAGGIITIYLMITILRRSQRELPANLQYPKQDDL